jgi:hypothetical protein
MPIVTKKGGTLPIDGNHKPVQVASNIISQDGTGTPLDSPQTISSSVVTVVPATNADLMYCRAAVADIRYGDNATLDGTADEGYGLIPAGSALYIPCADGGSIFFLRDAAADATLYFHFEQL